MKDWQSYNERYLRMELDRISTHLKQCLGQPLEEVEPDSEYENSNPPALERICRDFSLTGFERSLVLFCAGIKLDREFGILCSALRGDETKPWVSFDLALQVFNRGNWLPFNSQSTLRYWLMVEPDDPGESHLSPLRLDESILYTIAGYPTVDPQLESLLLPLVGEKKPVASHQALVDQIARNLSSFSQEQSKPVILLNGNEQQSRQSIAGQVASNMGLRLYRIDTDVLPRETKQLHNLMKRLERDSILHGCALLFDGKTGDPATESFNSLRYLLQRLSVPCLVTSEISTQGLGREVIKLDVKRPEYEEQKQLWQQALHGTDQTILEQQLPSLLDQFDLAEEQIQSIARQWLSATKKGNESIDSSLWTLCRLQSRHKIRGLARIIEPDPDEVRWDTLVLALEEEQILRSVLEQVKQRHRVYQEWGFAKKAAEGLGISALFCGVSGTGKTLAARVIASELNLDIYHIDLSAIVSKYIGETEKNLETIFSAAESSGAILLFDEADALFGKRSQVNDSRDRYANMEVSYLLQRMEAYKGLSILTTNNKNNMDDAFMRRIRFIVEFPFPHTADRAAIWRVIFPQKTPVNGLDYDKLARLEIPGGIIRGIAINATFHAASDNGKLEMKHILKATREEFTKSEKTLLPDLVADW